MNYRFEKENIKVHDIFYAEHFDHNGEKFGHYFYCIHTQEEDKNNELFRDITGLLITTKTVPGYTSQIRINGKDAFVCCDKEIRFASEVGKVQNKFYVATYKERLSVLKTYKRYTLEKVRQMKKGLKKK